MFYGEQMKFSQRIGKTPVQKLSQHESMDVELTNSLWSAMQLFYWDQFHAVKGYDVLESSNMYSVSMRLWLHYYKEPIDSLPSYFSSFLSDVRRRYYASEWFEKYDFIEFVADNGIEASRDEFIKTCNGFLERENSPYRFVDGALAEITSELDINAVENAIADSDQFGNVNKHLKCALAFLSNRERPDYRNSIKESISAVESICRIVTNDPKATLGSAVNKLGNFIEVHPAQKKAFSSLYGYTNDHSGIRHALLEDGKDVSKADAKYMLVSCSAFIGFIIEAMSKENT